MEIHATKEGNAIVISLKGRLDAVTSSEFEKSLSDWISKGGNHFLLNFSDLEYISSAGLRSILATSKKLKETQGKIFLTGLHGPVEEVFKISGFLSIFRVFASAEEALREIWMMAVLTSLNMPAKLENLGRLIASVSDFAKAQGFEQEKINKIELAAEEALVNIFHYAYPERPGDVEMTCKVDGGRFIVEIIDSGIPFDVTAMPDPDVTAAIQEREPGGLGIFFMKKVMDEIRYRRENDRNILTLIIQKH